MKSISSSSETKTLVFSGTHKFRAPTEQKAKIKKKICEVGFQQVFISRIKTFAKNCIALIPARIIYFVWLQMREIQLLSLGMETEKALLRVAELRLASSTFMQMSKLMILFIAPRFERIDEWTNTCCPRATNKNK